MSGMVPIRGKEAKTRPSPLTKRSTPAAISQKASWALRAARRPLARRRRPPPAPPLLLGVRLPHEGRETRARLGEQTEHLARDVERGGGGARAPRRYWSACTPGRR